MFSILVIDDDDISREALCESLLDFGDVCALRTARDSREAALRLEEFIPDVIFLDVVLPVMDGIETLKRIRFDKRFDDTVIVMMSGIMLDHVVEQVMQGGADFCVWKPVDAASVHERVKRMLIARKCESGAVKAIDESVLKSQSIISRLEDAGIDADLKGCDYLIRAIEITCDLNYIFEMRLVENIYEQVARSCNTTASRAERNMRSAIKKAWEKNPEKMSRALCVNRKPTTGDFVAKVAHMTKYWL